MKKQLLPSILVPALLAGSVDSAMNWDRQSVPAPEGGGGEHTGVAVYDLNGDGYLDLLFSAGRHSVDQSYALINLGPYDEGGIRFSDAIPIGPRGGFYQVDASSLSSLAEGHTAVLLAGGTCTVEAMCQLGYNQPAILLDVYVWGCSVQDPNRKCQSTNTEVWRDRNPAGDRNGAFAPTLGDGTDPAIVLAGSQCVSIFEPLDGAYPRISTFVVIPEEKVEDGVNNIDRAAALSVGHIGRRPGVIAGVRSSAPPSPLVAIYRTRQGRYEWFDFADGVHDRYGGDARTPVETTGLSMGDLNGDGITDVIESRYVAPENIVAGTPVQHYYYLIENNKTHIMNANTNIPARRLFSSTTSGRSVDVGQIFGASSLPDIVHGLDNGVIRLFSNLGLDEDTNQFLGFKAKDAVQVQSGCSIRDIKVASLAPCTVSLICAITCGPGMRKGMNQVFTKKRVKTASCRKARALNEKQAPIPSSIPQGSNSSGDNLTTTESILSNEFLPHNGRSQAESRNGDENWATSCSFFQSFLRRC